MKSLTYFIETSQNKSNWVWSWGKIWENVGQIMPNVVKKLMKQAISLGFFQILLVDNLLKQEAVVVKQPDWKFMAIMARNAKF